MASDAQKAQEQYEQYQYCRVEGGHDNFLREHELAKRYYASRQWLNEDEKKRTAEGRLSFVVNETFRTINAVRGELNQLSSDVRFDPTNGDPETARALNRLNEHVDRQNKVYMHDDRVILDGLLGGRGYWRVRTLFDENMQGQIDLSRQRPENVILDFDIDSPDPSTWKRVFTTEVVSTDDIANMFGKEYADEFGYMPYADWLNPEDRSLAQSIGIKTATLDESVRGFKRHRLLNQQFYDFAYKDCFVDKQTGDMSEIPENWPREKIQFALREFGLGIMRKKVRTLRWRVTCNNCVLHDEDSPYKFFDIVPFFPWFTDDLPLSLFTVLKGPQDLLNYTVSEETYILGNTAHSGWKVKHGSLHNMTSRDLEKKGGRNGVVLELDDVQDAERIQPGQPATGMAQFGDRARSWITDLGSVTPSMLGSQSEYANGKNISSNLQRAPVNLHAPLQMFQFGKQLLAERKLNLFQTYYTETRVLRIATSAYGQAEELAINAPAPDGTRFLNDLTVGKYTVRMMPVGSRQAADEFAFDQLGFMKELGINVPNSLFVATSAINAKSDVIEQLLDANKGEMSPEEQRMRELEVEKAELDVEDQKASIEGKHSAAALARGRAKRAFMEANFDSHAARAQLDQDRLASEHERGLRQIETQQTRDARSAAVQLTKIAVDAAKPAPKPAAPAKKAAKKTVKKTARKKTPKQ
jgi:hypothetical protein